MKTLFEISDDVRSILTLRDEWAEDHDGDTTEFPLNDHLNTLEGTMEEKALKIGLLIKELTAFGKSILGEGAAFLDLGNSFKERGQAKLNAADSLKKYLHDTLPNPCKYEDKFVVVRRQNNGGVEPVELLPEVSPEDLPALYQKIQVSINPDLIRQDAIKQDDPRLSSDCRYIMDGETPLAVVKPRGTHIRIA